MKTLGRTVFFVYGLLFITSLNSAPLDAGMAAAFTSARAVGRLQDERLVECSGMDASLSAPGMLWAVNDGGHGPFLYALASDGRNLGRVQVRGARNRDWEALDTFLWQGRPMILIADFGDNKEQHSTHTLYIVPEPVLKGDVFEASAAVEVAWRILFRYPDGGHDAEGVAVDTAGGEGLVLTKRDAPPLLFSLPLDPPPGETPVTARKVAEIDEIPPPSAADLTKKFGAFSSQPTALDLSADRRRALVLTYKHAYLFRRESGASWGDAFRDVPQQIPLPTENKALRQREAICFAPDDRAIFVTSEGKGAGIFRLDAR